MIDLIRDAQIRSLSTVWWHAGGNVTAVVIEIVNFFIRYGKGSNAVVPTGLVLSAAVGCILLLTGWKGWEMVYRSYVGVADRAPPEGRCIGNKRLA